MDRNEIWNSNDDNDDDVYENPDSRTLNANSSGVPKRQICLLNKHQNKLRNQTLNIKQTKG